MPLIIERNDITRMRVDAIVNAANNSLLGGGGVDGAIHRAAGPGLLKECRKLNGCRTGEAKHTGAYRLPCKYVIHTVGPVWEGGGRGEEALLRSCYRNSLRTADELGCESVAFPLISAGVYGYPRAEAINVAVSEIRAFLEEHEMRVTLVIFDPESFRISSELVNGLKEYIDDNYFEAHHDACSIVRPLREEVWASAKAKAAKHEARVPSWNSAVGSAPAPHAAPDAFGTVEEDAVYQQSETLESLLSNLDESFSQNLLHRIDASGMTDTECYKRANIDRKLFSKIRSTPDYKPSTPTAVAIAIALRLDIEAAKDLLRRAGFALSRSSKFDVIIEFFITSGRYDIDEINEALFLFDQPLLGS